MSWKMLNHPEAHLMKLHILLLPPVISWKLLTWAARYLSPPLCLCICLHYLDGKPQRVLPTYARVGSHEVRADGPCVCVCVCVCVSMGRWRRSCRADQWARRRRSCCTCWRHHISRYEHAALLDHHVACFPCQSDIFLCPDIALQLHHRGLFTDSGRRQAALAAQRQLSKPSTSVFRPIRPFSRCTTPWLRRTLTPCCRRCRTTSRRSWRKSRWRLSGWWRTRSLWWVVMDESGGEDREQRPLLPSVNDMFFHLCPREPPSGGMRPLGRWSWLGSWEEGQLTGVVIYAFSSCVALSFL